MSTLLIVGAPFMPQAAATLAPPNADTHIVSGGPNASKNFGTQTSLNVSSTSSALLSFNLATLPPGIVSGDVERATLILWVNKVTTAGNINVVAITSPWNESGLLGVTYNTRPGTGASIATVSIASNGVSQFVVVDVTNQVRTWLTTPSSNNGLELVAAGTTSAQFDSKEGAFSPPMLDISLVNEGPAGTAATIAVGSVTTGAPGSAATVTNSGTSSAAMFNFAIPQGANGTQGLQGLKGDPGTTGLQGLQGVKGDKGDTGPTGPQGSAGPNDVTGNITLVESTAIAGNVMKGTSPFIHNFGDRNTFLGVNAGNFSTTTCCNTATGVSALHSNATGYYNTATGYEALRDNTGGAYNTANGMWSLQLNTTGGFNTASGVSALQFNTTGAYNTAMGAGALQLNSTGLYNTALGIQALQNNTVGINNVATGQGSLLYNTVGYNNTASGVSALFSNTTGIHNSASGYQALYGNTTGNYNIALGANAGFNATTGSNNIHIGSQGVAADASVIRIGTQGTQQSTFIAGIHGVTGTGLAVVVNANGQLGTSTLTGESTAAFAAQGSGSVMLPANDYLNLVSLTLPTGKYVLVGQVSLRSNSGQPELVGIGCQMFAGTEMAGGSQATLLAILAEAHPVGTAELTSDGTVFIQCRTDNAFTVVVDQARLIATRVSSLN